MFNNRFNSTKKDPLVEAVQSAMQDGEIRRQAVAYVNEAFGVYNRNAVVREDLAEYDAAIEEAYKCMKEGTPENIMNPNSDWAKKQAADKSNPFNQPTPNPTEVAPNIMMRGNTQGGSSSMVDKVKSLFKEGKPLDPVGKEDDDIDNDGKRNTKSDKYLRNRRQTIGRAMGKQMEEEQIDELKAPTAKTAHDAYRRAERSDDEKGNWDRSNRLYRNLKKKYPGKSDRNQKPTGKAKLPQVSNTEFHNDGYSGHVTKKGKLTKSATKDTKADIKSRLGRHTKPNLPEEVDYSAPDRAAVTRDNKPSTPAQTNAATSGPSAADKAALASKISTMKEAAYSAKAARAGKDIGKPGKSFSMIAKKAGERYGSAERGKKVAGAILKRIRAKHMKEENLEELSAFGKAFAAAKGQNFSFGGKQYSGAMKGSSSAPKATSRPSGPQNNPGLGGAVKSGQFATRDTTPIPTRSPAQQQAKVDAANIRANKSAIPNPTISSPKITGTASGAGNVQSATGPRGEIRPGSSADYAQKSGGVLPMPTGGKPVGNDDVTGMVKNINKNPSAVASVNAANKPDSSSGGGIVDRARSAVSSALGIKPSKPDESDTSRRPMNESVQVGANKYRIV